MTRGLEGAHDLACSIDPDGLREGGAWGINRGEHPVVEQKAMRRATRIDKVPDDLAAIVDVKRVGERGARRIDRGKGALVEQKAMLGPAAIDVRAYDRA